jgi:hypothetical protein
VPGLNSFERSEVRENKAVKSYHNWACRLCTARNKRGIGFGSRLRTDTCEARKLANAVSD